MLDEDVLVGKDGFGRGSFLPGLADFFLVGAASVCLATGEEGVLGSEKLTLAFGLVPFGLLRSPL